MLEGQRRKDNLLTFIFLNCFLSHVTFSTEVKKLCGVPWLPSG